MASRIRTRDACLASRSHLRLAGAQTRNAHVADQQSNRSRRRIGVKDECIDTTAKSNLLEQFDLPVVEAVILQLDGKDTAGVVLALVDLPQLLQEALRGGRRTLG